MSFNGRKTCLWDFRAANWAGDPEQMARSLKFQLKEVNGLY